MYGSRGHMMVATLSASRLVFAVAGGGPFERPSVSYRTSVLHAPTEEQEVRRGRGRGLTRISSLWTACPMFPRLGKTSRGRGGGRLVMSTTAVCGITWGPEVAANQGWCHWLDPPRLEGRGGETGGGPSGSVTKAEQGEFDLLPVDITLTAANRVCHHGAEGGALQIIPSPCEEARRRGGKEKTGAAWSGLEQSGATLQTVSQSVLLPTQRHASWLQPLLQPLQPLQRHSRQPAHLAGGGETTLMLLYEQAVQGRHSGARDVIRLASQ